MSGTLPNQRRRRTRPPSVLALYSVVYPWSLRHEHADWARHGEDLLAIEQACFSDPMRAADHDLRGLVEDPDAMVLVLFDGDKAIGYIAGVPLEGESSSFNPDTDPRLGWGEFNTFYLDCVSILPGHRQPLNIAFLGNEAIRLGLLAGYQRCATHARRDNGAAAYAIRRVGFKRLRTCPNWFDTGEDFDYLVLERDTCRVPLDAPRWLGFLLALRRALAGSWLERRLRRPIGLG